MSKMKKDVNLLKQQVSIDLLKYKENIINRIKEIENEFDILDERLQHWEEYYNSEMSLFCPLVTIKHEDDRTYFYVYFRINNKKWTKEVDNGLDLTLDFTEDDLKYISRYLSSLNVYALKLIMKNDDYNKLMELRGDINYEY